MKKQEKKQDYKYKLTIVVRNYNAKKYLMRCMDKLLNQTCDKSLFEIIIADDGSTDGGEVLCDQYAEKYDNVTALHQPNSGGPSRGSNRGIDKARGGYIFFHDSDDYMGEEAVQRIIDHLDEWKPDMMLVKQESYDREIARSMFDKNYEFADPYDDKIIRTIGPIKVYSMAFLKRINIRWNEEAAMEDAVFNFEAYFRAKKISVASDYNYYYVCYRDDGNNITLLSEKKSVTYGTAKKRLIAWREIDKSFSKYLDKKRDWSNLQFKLAELYDTTLRRFLDLGCTQEQLSELQKIYKRWYNDEQAYLRRAEIYIPLHVFMENDNFDDMRELLTNVQKGTLPAQKKNGKIYVPIPVKKEKVLDISRYYRRSRDATLKRVEFLNKKVKIKFEVNSVLGVNDIDVLLVPNKNFDEQLLFKGKITKKIKCKTNEAPNYLGDVTSLMDKYEVEATIDLQKLNKLKEDEISWTFYAYIDRDRKTRLKNKCKEFFTKSFVLGNDILVPDVHNGNFICYRKISENYKNESGYIKDKKRPLSNKIILFSLLSQPFDVTKSIVDDVENDKLEINYSLLKRKIIYSYNGKKVKIPNKQKINMRDFLRKIKRKIKK